MKYNLDNPDSLADALAAACRHGAGQASVDNPLLSASDLVSWLAKRKPAEHYQVQALLSAHVAGYACQDRRMAEED